MFRTGVIINGNLQIKHITELGRVELTITVQNSVVVGVDMNTRLLGTDIVCGTDALYNKAIGDCIPALIAGGHL